jgi:hypothetical protein
MGSNSGRRREKRETNRLSYSTALSFDPHITFQDLNHSVRIVALRSSLNNGMGLQQTHQRSTHYRACKRENLTQNDQACVLL